LWREKTEQVKQEKKEEQQEKIAQDVRFSYFCGASAIWVLLLYPILFIFWSC
jgi:hypothetical protein